VKVSKEIKTKAQNEVTKALYRGDLRRQPCEICSDPQAQAHHDDYLKPLEVRWLCRSHHRIWHVNGSTQIGWASRQSYDQTLALKKHDEVPKTFRLPPETARKLEKASRADGVSQSVYLDQTLKARFKKDGVT
jgi:hypothetical protein